MRDPLDGKIVAILGFARQGQALARWLPTIGAHVRVSDGKSAEALSVAQNDYPSMEFFLGGHPETLLDDIECLCISGGVPLDLPIVQTALARGIPLTNDAQLFLERCPAPVIGITGSAGKTTTTMLTGEILRAAGFTVHVGGNTGDVLLDVLPEIQSSDRVVMELSSFQTELLSVSPDIAAILNITPNHLDRHGTMEAYSAAKARLIAFVDEESTVILGRDDAGSRALEALAPRRLAWFSAREMMPEGAFLAGNRLVVTGISALDDEPHVVIDREESPLRGEHNTLNLLAAFAISGAAGASFEAMASVARAFAGVAHRLETVRVLNDVTWVNDSIATAPERVMAALKSYDEPLVLLLGGRDKSLPWEALIAHAVTRCRAIILFGEARTMINEQLASVLRRSRPSDRLLTDDAIIMVETLDAAVDAAAATAQPGDVVLLSPGGTSYDAYPDFAARGAHFRALVQKNVTSIG